MPEQKPHRRIESPPIDLNGRPTLVVSAVIALVSGPTNAVRRLPKLRVTWASHHYEATVKTQASCHARKR
jgi:hypothetical protein